MNVGIYLNNLSDTDQLNHINNFVSESIKNKDVKDISIFYDNIGFNPYNVQCGMFDATELWSFNGNLIATSLDALNTTSRVINNINVFYYHGWIQEKNIMNLIIASQRDLHIICRSESDAKEVYRLTGKQPIGISQNFENIINLISRCKDEHKSNNNDVYQTA
jgi:hypothetical protein